MRSSMRCRKAGRRTAPITASATGCGRTTATAKAAWSNRTAGITPPAASARRTRTSDERDERLSRLNDRRRRRRRDLRDLRRPFVGGGRRVFLDGPEARVVAMVDLRCAVVAPSVLGAAEALHVRRLARREDG